LSKLRSSNEPLYAKASEAIDRYIDEQKLAPGDKLLPEKNLAELLGVSRSTIREGLRELELRRRITRIHGRGTIIAHRLPAVTGLTTMESLESIARRQGWTCGTSDISIGAARLPQPIAEALGRKANERVTKVVLVKTLDGQPMWLAETWVPRSVVTQEDVRARLKNTIFDLFGPDLPAADYAFSTVTAAAATTREADMLRIQRRSPLVVLTEIFYHSPDRALFFSRNALIPGKIELQFRRRPKGPGVSPHDE
jgi:GntR family transcriptional regulator